MRPTKHTKISPAILKRQPMDKSRTLFARSAAYALFSNLAHSPHEDYIIFSDLENVIQEIEQVLPFEVDFSSIINETNKVTDNNWKNIVQSYSALFEVGDDGPPIPIRESANDSLAFKKEEITRYYDYFGYTVSENRKWESDHLSIELEFIHFLCQGERESEDALSFQLAQKDFIDRHLILWLASVHYKMEQLDAHPFWMAIFSALFTFIQKDLNWLKNQTNELKEAI